MTIVFDTNVLFSAFVSHGVCAGLYEECLQRADIVVSPPIIDELARNLQSKAKLSTADLTDVLHALRLDARIVIPSPLRQPICRDADDDWILATATAAGADAIVTGDADRLTLQSFEGIRILTPRDCLVLVTAL